jgi:Putative Ig domain
MKGFKPFPFLALSFYLCVLTACGSSHPPNGPSPLNIANPSLPQGVVQSAYSVTLVPTGGLGPYTWTLNSGTLPPGLNLSSGGVISGTPLSTDLTPTGTAKTYSFVVKVTDSQTPTAAFQTGNFSIIINPLPVVTSTTLLSGTIGLTYNAPLTNTGGLAPFTWTVVLPGTGPLPAGLSINGAAITGTPTGPAGTFPFTIQVTDADGNTASAQVSIAITGKLQGTFAFSFNGFNNGKPFYFAGSFIGDGGGNITSGVLDQNGVGATHLTASFTGTYNVTSNNLGSMSFTVGSPLNVTYNFALAASLQGDLKFILGDPNSPNVYGSGVIKTQNLAKVTGSPLSALAGNYAMGFFGVDPTGNRSAGAGAFEADGSGNLTNGIEDTNDNGAVEHIPSFTGSWAVDTDFATTGRGTETLNGLQYAFYVVDPTSELITVQIDRPSSGLSLVSVLKQLPGSVNGIFGNSALNASSVMELNGYTGGSSPLPDVQLGVSTFDGSGHIILYQTDENKGGTVSENVFTAGTYNVDPSNPNSGRVIVAGLGSGPQPVWYLVSANRAFVIGTDSSVTQGLLEPQTGAPFSLPSFLLTYAAGTIDPVLPSVTNEVDSTVIPPPGGTINVTYDTSGPGGPQSSQGLSSTYALGDDPNNTGMNTTGKFILTAKGSAVPTQIVYIITGQASGSTMLAANKWAAINVALPSGAADLNPKIVYAESTHP